MGVQDDANRVLQELEKFGQIPNDSQRGRYSLDGDTLVRLAEIDPDRLNDAVELLEESALVEASHYLGTMPYGFADVSLTARGRVQAEQLSKTSAAKPLAWISTDRK